MQQFKKLNLLGGILVGIIATIVYTLTMEASTSLWDCGEFIAASQKLQVVHPPGAPNFLMIARMFTLFAFGNPEAVSITLNFMSALCSGLAMMFLFWITTYMGQKILIKTPEDWTNANSLAILGAGLIGGLTGTFLDSIWFSAVEAEVYSMSLLFTAIVFWLMCLWESKADEPQADRYLLLIAFLMGISIFVHWLNLLTIPTLGLIYYFRRTQTATFKGIIITLMVSVAVLLFFLSGIITGIVDMMAALELAMVNGMGMPFNSGLIVFLILFVGAIILALKTFRAKNWALAHNILLAFVFILIGFSTITTTVIRSNSGPYIDMNSPRDIVSLSSYLHRDQYGSRPIFFGHYFTEKPIDVQYTGTRYAKGEHKYDEVGKRFEYKYATDVEPFARMYDSNHRERYLNWLGISDPAKRASYKPNLGDNIYFFFVYQINYMYVRYFMWNFVGRQNDEQGTGDGENGNWLGGISAADNLLNGRLDPQTAFLPDFDKNHPARNTYYYIPLLLGLLGVMVHFKNNKRSFVILTFLFLLTGVALIIYGNSPPIEPRERDYIFAASFYTFAAWVGLGVIGIYSFLKKLGTTGALASLALCLAAPAIMATQNWDDHDRSERTAARDFAANYLNSCAPNAILFTQGDNDTYPLWYAQQVENIRTDVRIVNLSLLGVDWYIAQCRQEMDGNPPVKFTLGQEKIRGSLRDQVLYNERTDIAPADRYVSLEDLMNFIGDDARMVPYGEDKIAYYPTQKMSITCDIEQMVANNVLQPSDAGNAVPQMQWNNPKTSLLKHDLMVLDIINTNAKNGWERPIYFAVSVERGAYQGLEKYFHQEGLAYRLLPIPAEKEDPQSPFAGEVNANVMKDNMLNKYKWGGLDKAGVFPGTDLSRMVINMRSNFTRLADKLIVEGKKEEAIEVLDFCQKSLTADNIPYSIYSFPMVLSYYDAGADDKGSQLGEEICTALLQKARYYNNMKGQRARMYDRDKETYLAYAKQFIKEAQKRGQQQTVDKLNALMTEYNLL